MNKLQAIHFSDMSDKSALHWSLALTLTSDLSLETIQHHTPSDLADSILTQ